MRSPLFDIENWKEIGATLARNKTRTFLTAFGIFWGTAMLAMLWGGAQGLQDIMRSQFDGFATNVAFLFPGKTSIPYKGYNKGMSWSLTQTDLSNMRRSVADIEAMSAFMSYSALTATYGTRHTSTSIQGVESTYPMINVPLMYDGRFINESDDVRERKVCVIGKRISNDLFGTESGIGKYISISGIYYRVVGVCGQKSEVTINNRLDESVVIPLSTMRKAYNLGDDVGGVIFMARNGVSPTDLQPTIERIIRASHPIHPDDKKAITFFDISEMFKMVDNLFIGISILVLFVGIGTLLAGIIGVGNIMWVIVKERTQEIGIRRAIGAKPRDIITQILSESVMLTTIAGIAGICFAVLVLGIANTLTATETSQPEFQLQFSHAITIMVTFMVLGTAAGTIPAVKAMRIKPIEAMNDK